MFKTFFKDNNLYIILLFWVLIGIFTGPLVYAIIPLHILYLRHRGNWLVILLGLWLILTLSDNRHVIFSFTQSVKPVLMAFIGVLALLWVKNRSAKFFLPFIPFFLIAVYALMYSPIQFDSFQKTVSYILILLVIPWIVNLLIEQNRDRFLYHLVMLGTVILFIGLILRVVYPGFVIFIAERYSGLFGNPNGLGIYCFIFMCIATLVFYYHPNLFNIKERVFVYILIFLSVFLSDSRGGLFSIVMFLSGWFLFRKNLVVGFIVMGSLFISYQLVIENFTAIATSLGLQDFFRLETLETGSGRVVARAFAWENIETQYWMGKGIGYTEYLMNLHAEEFIATQHQGNLHNSYLTLWLDTGLIGLIAFCFGWLRNFLRAGANTPLVWAVLFGTMLSTSVESWLSASLNPFTIQLVIILSMLANKKFYNTETTNLPYK